MTTLNLAYLVSIFQAALDANAQNTYALVPAESPEVAALVKAKYIKTSKRLHNADGNIGATLVEGATMSDLKIDFEIPDAGDLAAEAAPVVEQVAAAPFTTVDAEAAAAPTFTPTVEHTDMQQATAPVADLQPQVVQPQVQEGFAPAIEQVAQTAHVAEQVVAAPVQVTEEARIIGEDNFTVATTVQTLKGEVEIDVGVPFVQQLSAKERRQSKTKLEHHPFGDIAAFKEQNPQSVPSFHLAGRAVKDVSNSVRRANARFEKENSNITFRARSVDATDPKGAGVRVYAMFVSEAPEQRHVSKPSEAE